MFKHGSTIPLARHFTGIEMPRQRSRGRVCKNHPPSSLFSGAPPTLDDFMGKGISKNTTNSVPESLMYDFKRSQSTGMERIEKVISGWIMQQGDDNHSVWRLCDVTAEFLARMEITDNMDNMAEHSSTAADRQLLRNALKEELEPFIEGLQSVTASKNAKKSWWESSRWRSQSKQEIALRKAAGLDGRAASLAKVLEGMSRSVGRVTRETGTVPVDKTTHVE